MLNKEILRNSLPKIKILSIGQMTTMAVNGDPNFYTLTVYTFLKLYIQLQTSKISSFVLRTTKKCIQVWTNWKVTKFLYLSELFL